MCGGAPPLVTHHIIDPDNAEAWARGSGLPIFSIGVGTDESKRSIALSACSVVVQHASSIGSE